MACITPLTFAQTPEQKILFNNAYAVFEKHCFKCHGPEKSKGGLRLDSHAAVLKGSKKSDNVVVAGHADQSELTYRVRLPVSDDDVMPPPKQGRLTNAEIVSLITWVDNGAPWVDGSATNGSEPMSSADVAELHKPMGVDLTQVMTPEEEAWFKNNIEQVLSTHCVGCHGPQKEKGDLRLDSTKFILAGGENGPALVPGDPAKSELLVRMLLPIDDEDVMPPEDKGRIPHEKIEAIRKWIADGARFPPPKSKLARGGENHYSRFFDALVGADKANVEWLKENGVFIEPLIWEGGGLRILFSHSTIALDPSVFDRLKPWLSKIRWVDFANTSLTDAAIDFANSLDQLLVLHLERTNLDDAMLAKLNASSSLEYLNLHSTKVSDASIPALKKLGTLRKLYLWNAPLTPEGVERLKRPGLHVVYQ
ncbi:MAG: mono/diheme cytochrome c family protein [Verrucomicrobiales bacterium]|jgi:mono/diheme cytochrome c family protein